MHTNESPVLHTYSFLPCVKAAPPLPVNQDQLPLTLW